MQRKGAEGLWVAACSFSLLGCYLQIVARFHGTRSVLCHPSANISAELPIASTTRDECNSALKFSSTVKASSSTSVFCLESALTACSQGCRGLMRDLSPSRHRRQK